MKRKISPSFSLLSASCLAFINLAQGQDMQSKLHFTSKDAIYTTYAAPLSRTDYKTDQAYELMWLEPDKPIGFKSKDGGEIGLLFAEGPEFRSGCSQFSGEPFINQSYSDIVQLTYSPFSNLEVAATFCVYSSNACILEYTLTNSSKEAIPMVVYPYFRLYQGISAIQPGSQEFSFSHQRNKDSWMTEHNIPLTENFHDAFLLSESPDGAGIFDTLPATLEGMNGKLKQITQAASGKALVFQKNLVLKAGESKKIRIIRYGTDASKPIDPLKEAISLLTVDMDKIMKESEKAGIHIPSLLTLNNLTETERNDRLGLYYSAFNLLRQCMMPAEGECKTNYYVFSREPKWGWGYGGQVFHESLSMLAYVYMDPQGAMNSQRVFMDRQQKDGYINYRTGPYLDETIETNGMKTSSAPWFSYTNLEIYKVTRDKVFLQQAYDSGRKLYKWFTFNRDKDQDGLYEWGGDATLESVRDGDVAVWDKVSKPENLEGPDLNSMMVMEAISLSMMAKELKLGPDISTWLNTAAKLATKMNKQLWDPETKFYYNTLLSTNGFTFISPNDLKIKEIIGFLPLWANMCNKEQAQALVQTMSNAEEFWRPYGIPTLSAKDSYYNPMGYWNGPVWVQWQYLLFRGLIDYGYYPMALQLGDKVIDQMTWHLKNDHTFWEFYSPDNRQAGWNKTYIWAGIVARMMIDMDKIRTEVGKKLER